VAEELRGVYISELDTIRDDGVGAFWTIGLGTEAGHIGASQRAE